MALRLKKAMITYINYSNYNWKKCNFCLNSGLFDQLFIFIFILDKFFNVACGETFCIEDFFHQKTLSLSGDALKLELHFAMLCIKDWRLPSGISKKFHSSDNF